MDDKTNLPIGQDVNTPQYGKEGAAAAHVAPDQGQAPSILSPAGQAASAAPVAAPVSSATEKLGQTPAAPVAAPVSSATGQMPAAPAAPAPIWQATPSAPNAAPAGGSGPQNTAAAGQNGRGIKNGFMPIPGYGAPPPPLPPPAYMPFAYPPAPPPKARARARRAHPAHIALLAMSTALVVLLAILVAFLVMLSGTVQSLFNPRYRSNSPPSGTFSVVNVVGNIANVGSDALGIFDPSYHHAETLEHIEQLTLSDNNAGILLYMNTPGGGVYESDEMYLALQNYKEKTGRPVWAFMADMCASGGYYIAAAADAISANRNTITGSIGVYIALTDTSQMYEMEGVRTILVRSGDNKGVGMEGVPITDDQAAVYQGVVDEMYERFVGIVAEGRGLSQSDARALSDGRIYTAQQALDNGLIDEIGDWESTLAAFETETGASPFYPSFSRRTALGSILGGILGEMPKTDVQTLLEFAEQHPSGVPLAYYSPAA